MKIVKLIPLFLILFALIFMLNAPSGHQLKQQAESPDGLQFVGKVLPNGDVAVLYYAGPTGTIIIHSNTLVPVNQIYLEIYSVNAGNLTIQGKQFTNCATENLTQKFADNQTLTTHIKVPENPSDFNQTMTLQARSFQETSLVLPTSNGQQTVQLTMDNVTFTFLHKTSPDILPTLITGLGTLGIAIGFLVFGIVIFFAGTITAAFLIGKMKYWPPLGKMGWMLFLIFLVIIIAGWISVDYYQVAAIGWYVWIVPLYLLATLAMMDLWPNKVSRWYYVLIDTKQKKPTGDIQDIDVSGYEGEWEYCDRHSRIDAIMRLLGKHYLINFPQEDPQYLEGKGSNTRIYGGTERCKFDYVQHTRKGRKGEKTKNRREKFTIPAIGKQLYHIMGFWVGIVSIPELSKRLNLVEGQVTDLRVAIHNGTSKVNTSKLDRITKILMDEKFTPEAQLEIQEREESKEKEKEEGGSENDT